MNSFKNKIQKLYIFEGFEDKFIETVIEKSRIEVFEKGECVIKEGELSKKAYIVVSGIVSVDRKGKIINTIFEGDIFGEIALVTNEARTATIRAETELKLLTFDKYTLLEIMQNMPNGDIIQNTILNRIIMNNRD